MRLAEIRFDVTNTISQVKEILERKFGGTSETMALELRDTQESFVAAMTDNTLTLLSYGPQENYTIHVYD